VDGVLHTYTLDGTKILREVWDGNTLVPLYDNEDSVCGIVYNNEPHFFIKNLQGDVIAIANARGEVEARYSYDAWGVPTVTLDASDCQIATINPFRYRGYYYDAEIAKYYLQSRYYDAELGRFVNGDHPEVFLSNDNSLVNNAYSYCHNNPVNNLDSSGNLIASTIAKIVLGVLFGLLVQFVGDLIVFVCRRLIEGKNATFNPVLGDYVGSGLTWGLASVNPFGQKYKVLAKLFNFVPVLAKYACKLIRGEKIYIFDLITDLLAVFVSLIVSSAINKNTANKIKNLKNLNRSKLKTPGFKVKKMELKCAGKILGQKFSFAFNLSPTIIETIYHCIVGV
jgi:RHS repeat-associated protein